MRSRMTLVALVLLSTYSTPAHSGNFYSGNYLHESCSAREGERTYFQKDAQCRGYVAGVIDQILRQRFKNQEGDCFPQGVQLGQLVDVVRDYLINHPEDRHYAAAAIVEEVVLNAFPNCRS